MQVPDLTISTDELLSFFQRKYSRMAVQGWGPGLRLKYDYFSPDDHYEALVGKLLKDGAEWCDVGCGRQIFPDYRDLAGQYASRCSFVFGIDPADNVRENKFLHGYFQGLVEDCPIQRQFDLITLRMVAEHIANPTLALSRVARLLKPSGHVVIYTPYKWAPMSIVANVTPFLLHNPLKQVLWPGIQARDTFPTQYKLNTFTDVRRHAAVAGLDIVHFVRLDDCRMTAAYRFLNRMELRLRKLLRTIGLPHPEACIVAVLRHRESSTPAQS